MAWKAWWPVGAVALGMGSIFGLLILLQPERDSSRVEKSIERPKGEKVEPEKTPASPSDWIDVGGVKRPPSDVARVQPESKISGKGIDRPTPKKPEGATPLVPASTNAQTMLVAQALKDGKNPERLSSFIVPRSFDKEAFEKAPEEYAKKYSEDVEPGRVYATAQPGEGVKPIRSVGERFHRVKQGESVRLIVESAPYAPVSFASHKLGSFANSLPTITVVADAEGKAVAEFKATSGTKDKIDILAASPVTSGQVNFVVMVSIGS